MSNTKAHSLQGNARQTQNQHHAKTDALEFASQSTQSIIQQRATHVQRERERERRNKQHL